jgi:long-chain acyl-CoA synthetase
VIASDGAVIASSNQVGELQLSGPGLFSGYVGTNDGAIHRSLYEWFPTGDLVSYDKEQQIVYRGRIKNVINSGGYKIYPEELERIILSFPGIEQANISSQSDDSLGEVPVAELVVKAGHTVDLDSLRIFCAGELSPHEIPREFSVVESLPLTGSGKVKKY